MSGWQDGFKAKAKSATIAPDDHPTHVARALSVSLPDGNYEAHLRTPKTLAGRLGAVTTALKTGLIDRDEAMIVAMRLTSEQPLRQPPITVFHAQLDYPPSANRYWRTTRTGRVYVSPEAKAYKAKVAMRFAGRKPMHGPVRVMLNVFRPKKQGDLDNVRKVLYDALEGFAYFDDKQIVEDHAWLGDDKFNPRVVIKIELVK